MNWYSKIAALEPGAWDWHTQTHKIVQDKPYVNSPFGGLIYQKPRPKQELESDYFGVHVTQDPKLAAVYANNFATPEDPPVVVEISNTQKWEIDIDAVKNMFDAETVKSEWLDRNLDYNIRNIISKTPKNKKIDVIEQIMDDIADLDTGGDYEDYDSWEDVADVISRNAQRKFPSAFIEYWRHFYGDNAPKAFYNYFILPMYFNKGKLDNRYQGWFINQMRFMEPVQESQVTAIYTFEPFSLELSREYKEDKEQVDENNKKMYGYEDLDYGSPHLTKIWERQQNQLLPQVFDVFYHGTTLSRARAALPELMSVLNKIK